VQLRRLLVVVSLLAMALTAVPSAVAISPIRLFEPVQAGSDTVGPLDLAAGIHTIRRFYDDGTVIQTRSVTFAAGRTFFDRTMTLDGTRYRRIDAGEHVGWWASDSDGATVPPGTWKGLVLVYPGVNADLEDRSAHVDYTADPTLVATVVGIAHSLPRTVYEWSDEHAGLSLTFEPAGHPIAGVLHHQGRHSDGEHYTVEKTNLTIADDIASQAYSDGTLAYDSIFVLWPTRDALGSQMIKSDLGLTNKPTVSDPPAPKYGFTRIQYRTPSQWTGAYPVTPFVHEWLHQVQSWMVALGYQRVPQVHTDDARCGYTKDADGTYVSWYSAVMSTFTFPADGLRYGIGPEAWADPRTPLTGGVWHPGTRDGNCD
jgi:hypothetical protein